MVDLSSVIALSELIQSVGVTAILILMLIWFIQGRVISEAVVDKFLRAMEEQTEITAARFSERVEEAVRKGFLTAFEEMDGGITYKRSE